MVPTTQIRLALETEEERRAKNGLDELDLICFNFKESARSPCNENHFSSQYVSGQCNVVCFASARFSIYEARYNFILL